MTANLGDREKFYRTFILILAIVVSVVFFYMIRGFIVTVLMAAIVSGLAFPLYRRLLRRVRGHGAVAAVLTLLTLLLLVVLPLVAFMGIVATEAVSISQSVTPWVRDHLDEPGEMGRLLDRVTNFTQIQEQVQGYSAQIVEKLGQLAGRVSSFLVNSLSAATSFWNNS